MEACDWLRGETDRLLKTARFRSTLGARSTDTVFMKSFVAQDRPRRDVSNQRTYSLVSKFQPEHWEKEILYQGCRFTVGEDVLCKYRN